MAALSLLCSHWRLGGLTLSSVSRQSAGGRHRNVMRGRRTPVVQPEVVPPPPAWSDLLRPGMFTLLFTGGSLGGCAIWQYENMREISSRTIRKTARRQKNWLETRGRKAGAWREAMRQWWVSLSPSERLFWPICGINVLVFTAWRVPALQPFMARWFLSGPSAPARCLPMILSTFSHYGTVHLVFNMMALYTFIDPAVRLLGVEQFLGVYLSAGVISSLASMSYKVATRSPGLSLGASGAICCVLGMFASYQPDAQLCIIFLPMVTFSASLGVRLMMAADAAGMLLRWRYLDHAGHLGGMLYGLYWAHHGSSSVWASREGLVTAWHHLRNRFK